MLLKILSGGQTGVDRAALDVAIQFNIPHGGWCPKGRLAELGEKIPEKYLLQETSSSDYSERTKLNIRDADATLIFILNNFFSFNDGTFLTFQEVKKNHKPYMIINLSQPCVTHSIVSWIKANHIHTLNVAGPRESSSPGIYRLCFSLLTQILSVLLFE